MERDTLVYGGTRHRYRRADYRKEPLPCQHRLAPDQNAPAELDGLFEAIRADIDTYVLKFFMESHKKINTDRRMAVMNTYMQGQLAEMRDEDIKAVKQYLMDVSKANSEYRKQYKKSGESIAYFDLIPLHSIVEKWLMDIQNTLNYPHLSDKMKTQLIKDTTVLFRDRFNFYNLR
ncbi:MAG: hypothetical protein HFF44_01060 [Lawsonibacter sp.]|nr:hypothetical protein [Lawsonibacter sp.]